MGIRLSEDDRTVLLPEEGDFLRLVGSDFLEGKERSKRKSEGCGCEVC